jgi:hypothetical protein
MVREDEIDFGIWKTIKPDQLVIPLDVHVMNVAKKYSILPENQKPSWQTAIDLTNYLKMNTNDISIYYAYMIIKKIMIDKYYFLVKKNLLNDKSKIYNNLNIHNLNIYNIKKFNSLFYYKIYNYIIYIS